MTTEPKTKTFKPARPIWCAGCGDFAVQGVLEKSLKNMGIPPINLCFWQVSAARGLYRIM